MNAFDQYILDFLNSFAHQSYLFDAAVAIVASNTIFKGGLAIPVLWWLWFRDHGAQRDKEYVLATLILCLITIFAARAIAFGLPFRPRPLNNTLLHFTAPYAAETTTLIGWSAFPSDHAAVFFALATGIIPLSRLLGACGYVHAFFLISLPRIYLGLHNPTDIIAGALLGITLGSLVRLPQVRTFLTCRPLELERSRPGLFYVILFVLSSQLVVLFDPIRTLATDLYAYFKHRL